MFVEVKRKQKRDYYAIKRDIRHAARLGTMSATIQLKCTFPKTPMGEKKNHQNKTSSTWKRPGTVNEEGLTPKDIYSFIYLFTI